MFCLSSSFFIFVKEVLYRFLMCCSNNHRNDHHSTSTNPCNYCVPTTPWTSVISIQKTISIRDPRKVDPRNDRIGNSGVMITQGTRFSHSLNNVPWLCCWQQIFREIRIVDVQKIKGDIWTRQLRLSWVLESRSMQLNNPKDLVREIVILYRRYVCRFEIRKPIFGRVFLYS